MAKYGKTLGSFAIDLKLDDSAFQQSMAGIKKQSRYWAQEMKTQMRLADQYGTKEDKLAAKKSGLTNVIEAQRKELDKLKKRYEDSYDETGKATAKTLDYAREVRKAEQNLSNYEIQLDNVSKELKEYQRQQELSKRKLVVFGDDMIKVGAKLEKTGEKMSKIGSSLTKAFTVPLTLGVGFAVKAAADYEDAFAGVRKTVEGTEKQFKRLSDEFRSISKEIPVSASELANLGEVAGQLGIETDNIDEFVRVIADLGVATNLAGEEGASQLAKFANVMNMSQKDFDRLGSALVDLGNHYATTEADIMAMASRLAGAGAQIGLSEADVLGLSTALSSVGIEAEMGGSAFSKIMINMQVASKVGLNQMKELSEKTGLTRRELELMKSNDGKAFKELASSLNMTTNEMTNIMKASKNLEGFASIAGMTGEQFKQAFEKDAVGAIGAFIGGLGDAEDKGSSAIELLDEMGIREVRLRDSLLRAANATDMFSGAVKTSNEAWGDNTALTNEAEEKYKTFNSQLQIFKNKLQDIAIEFGGPFMEALNSAMDASKPLLDTFKNLAKSFTDLPKKTQQNVVKFTGLAIAAGPLLKIFGGLTSGFGGLLKTFGKGSKLLGTLGFTFKGFATGPLGLTVLAVGALTAGFVYFYKKSDGFRKAIDKIGDGMNKAKKKVRDFTEAVKLTIKLEGPMAKLSQQTDALGIGVEKSTKKALGSYVKMSEGAEKKLHELYAANKNVTDGLVKQYTKAGDAALKAMNESSQKQHDRLKWLFDNNSALSEEEEAKILAKLDEDNKNKEKKAQENVDKINEILRVAKEEKRALKEEEKEEILRLQRELDEQVVSSVAKKEAEQQVILERMKRNSIAMSTEAASHEIKKANEARDKTIEAAAKKRDKTIAEAIYQRDTTGTLSRQQADKVIASAEDEYKQVTKKARDTRTETVNTITAQNSEIVTNVDTKTGEVKTKWQKMWEAVKGSTKKGAQDTSSGWDWVLKLLGAGVTKPAFPYAKGTPQGGHPGGLAIVGDGGKHELVVPKGGKPFLSPATDTLIPLPKGSEVLSGEKTEMLFKNMIPQYKNGTGGFLDKLISSSKSAFSKVKDWSVGIWDWLTSKTKVKELLANKIGPQNIVGVDLHKKLHDSGMSKSIDLASSDIFKRAETLMPMGGFVGDTSIGSNGVYNYLMNIARSLMRKYNMVFTSGFRPGDPYDHGKGLAVDIALPGVVNGSPIYQAAAEDAIRMPGVKYVITNGKWKHKGKSWVPWPDGDHYDHVHISGEKPVKSSYGGTGVDRWRETVVRALQITGQYSPANVNRTLYQMKTESGGNPRAINNWDINAKNGTPSKGLMQVIDPTFRAYAKAPFNKDIYDPLSNIIASIRYATSRYGSLAAAYRGTGYENGGLVNRHQIAQIAEGNKPEMIIPLTKKTRAVELINKAKSIIGMENGSVVVNNDTERLEALVAKQADMVESMSEKIIALLEVIAQKELTIDDESFNRNVNSGQGMLLKKNLVRG
ncbi:phage tail tape measure protein [Vagococcus lutrae]|uniref:phage tail tape measure protein n=1 Tax=Vagococcus lutrae TaxID=81947 RepID=UPI00288CAAE8|nr:phage tail tape measure protein [Vagococcus lutrae]MDT2844656.1 phage tail tape measure protein [Vagococcus lutrae]